ncbi:hypothetical protein BsWGS_18231 [Bradybaena similaris]
MAPKGKSRNEDLVQEDILQAVVIADSFNVRFGPITYKKPRTLLPLVNIPLIEYTFEALAASGVQEVFVFCCHLGDQVREHIKQSKWMQSTSPMMVTTLKSDSCLSMGDALREIDAKSLIRNDFILITGDLVSNMNISEVVKEHKVRTQGKDKSSVMTLVYKVALPGHRTRSKEDDMFLVEEGGTGRLLYFQKSHDSRKIKIPMDIMLEHDDIINHNDLMDCHISVCSPVVPTLFTDNFDYQTRDDFVKGILVNEEIMGNKIHLSIIRDKYAARVSNMHTYDAISKDVITRWTYPLVPDLFGSNQGERIKYGRHNVYCSEDVTLSRGCELRQDVVVGSGTQIGSGSVVSGCVVGRNCSIGENVVLRNSYLWDNVTVEDNCVIDTALLCSGVKVLNNVNIKKGVILAWEVIVGPDVTVPQGTQLMSEPQTDGFDDMDLSFGENEGAANNKILNGKEDNIQDTEKYGQRSKAYLYKPDVESDNEEEGLVVDVTWGLSASDSEDHLSYDSDGDDDSRKDQDVESDIEDGEPLDLESDEDDEDVVDSALGFNPKACAMERNTAFYQELLDTLLRASSDKISDDNLILEINSLKHAYTVPIDQVIHSLPSALIEMAAQEYKIPISAEPPFLAAAKKNIEQYSSLLCYYIKNNETKLIAINGLGDFVISHKDLQPRLPQFLNFLYDADVLTEQALFGWFESSNFTPGSNEALRHSFLKKLAQPFIKWLQEAEEESSEDDDDD